MLTREEAADITARFSQQRPSFERVASVVHRQVINLLHKHAVPSVITSRAKSVESLQRTLWRDREKWSIAQFKTALAPPLVDLAGIRILLYRESDVEPARDALFSHFSNILKAKDKRSDDGYSAYHLVITDWCEAADDENRDIRMLPCEIQICTILEHVWNELEHDIKYKQPNGRPDAGQEVLLADLRSELDLCARTARRLIDRTDARARANDEQLVGPHDLRRYLEGRFARQVDGPFEELWDFIAALNDRVSPRVMDDLFGQGRNETQARAIRDGIDLDCAHRDVGVVTVMLLPAFRAADVRDLVGADGAPPLWRFMLRVLNSDAGEMP